MKAFCPICDCHLNGSFEYLTTFVSQNFSVFELFLIVSIKSVEKFFVNAPSNNSLPEKVLLSIPQPPLFAKWMCGSAMLPCVKLYNIFGSLFQFYILFADRRLTEISFIRTAHNFNPSVFFAVSDCSNCSAICFWVILDQNFLFLHFFNLNVWFILT